MSAFHRRLPISHEHAAATAALPELQTDPFDRLLIAQASCPGLPAHLGQKILKLHYSKLPPVKDTY